MIAVFINAAAVLAGASIGLMIGKVVKPKYTQTIMSGLALCTLIIGVQNALKTQNIIISIVSIVLGSICGEIIDIEHKLEKFSDFVQKKFSKKNGDALKQTNSFSQGFLSASLLFCVGAMSVVGSLKAGIDKDYEIIFAKSVLDFVAAVSLSCVFGWGVLFSAVTVLIYQGALTALSSFVAPFLSETLILEISAVGGVMIVGMAMNMLGATTKKIRAANMLPALVFPALIMPAIKFLTLVVSG